MNSNSKLKSVLISTLNSATKIEELIPCLSSIDFIKTKAFVIKEISISLVGTKKDYRLYCRTLPLTAFLHENVTQHVLSFLQEHEVSSVCKMFNRLSEKNKNQTLSQFINRNEYKDDMIEQAYKKDKKCLFLYDRIDKVNESIKKSLKQANTLKKKQKRLTEEIKRLQKELARMRKDEILNANCGNKDNICQVTSIRRSDSEASVLVTKCDQGYNIETISKKYSFPSVKFTNGVSQRRGSYYYEIKLKSDSLMQLGFGGVGVGDDRYGWAYDGYRRKKWHEGKNIDYGLKWKKGDRVGLGINLDEKHIQFWLNNQSMEIAFNNVNFCNNNNNNNNESMMYPYVSLSYPSNIVVIFDSNHFKGAIPKGYKSFDIDKNMMEKKLANIPKFPSSFDKAKNNTFIVAEESKMTELPTHMKNAGYKGPPQHPLSPFGIHKYSKHIKSGVRILMVSGTYYHDNYMGEIDSDGEEFVELKNASVFNPIKIDNMDVIFLLWVILYMEIIKIRY